MRCGESSGEWTSTGSWSGRRRNGVGRRECGGSRKRAARRRPERSSPSGGRDRPKIVEEQRALVLLANRRRLGSGELQTRRTLPRLARERERAGEGLVGVREGKVTDLVRFANLEAPLRMKEGRLRSTDDRVHMGDLPLPDRELLRAADDAPMVPRRMGHVNHRVPLLLRAPFLLDQRTRGIE